MAKKFYLHLIYRGIRVILEECPARPGRALISNELTDGGRCLKIQLNMASVERKDPRFNQILGSGIERIRDWLTYAYWILYRTVIIFRQDRVQFQANALAYRSLISLVPMLAVLFSFFALFQGFIGEDNIEKTVMGFLSRYLMPQAEAGEMIINQILKFVKAAKAGTFIGFILFLLTSVFLFNAIERSFNLIWKVERYRSLTQRFIIFTATLFLGPILIGLSIYITGKGQVKEVIGRFMSSPIAQEIPISGFLSQLMDMVYKSGNVVVPYLLMLFVLMILYMAVPNTRVERWAAFIGAAFAALCWELSKWGFGYFAKSMFDTRVNVYGIFAGFFMFLILMYLIAVIVLFGAELSYVIQHYRHLVRVDPRYLRPVNDAYLACRAVLNIAHRYLKGEDLPGIPELAAKFSVSIPQMRSVINRLAGAKILVRIGAGAGDSKEVYEPNRELDQITLEQVIEAAATDFFFKTNHAAIEKNNTRRKTKDRDTFDEQCRAYLDDLFMKVQGNARETVSQISLRDIILTKTQEPDTQ